MKRVLIDTDVILDFFFDKKPFSDHAARVLSLCESKEIKGFITSVIISNVYYILRQTSTHEKVIEKLKQLITITEVLTTDKKIVLKALNSKFNDFEDALQNYSAIENQCEYIITRNIVDYKNSKLKVVLPEDFIKLYQ